MTQGRKGVAAALLFLGAAALAGVVPRENATVYRVFGLVEGSLALLFTFVLLERRVWERTPGFLGALAVAYGTAANAQILALLLPAPGLLQWVCVIGVVFLAWAALALTSRARLIALLGGLAVILALVKFSIVPVLWSRSGPAPGEAFGLGTALEGVRRLVVDYEPVPPGAQLFGVAAIALWALATRTLWRAGDDEEDWLATVPGGIRRRLRADRPEG